MHLTRASFIRELIAEYRQDGKPLQPAEMAAELTRRHGFEFERQQVSCVLTREKTTSGA